MLVVLVVLVLVSATSLTVSIVLGLDGRVVRVRAFFTMPLGMVKVCVFLFWGDVTLRMLAAPRCLVIAALISSCSAWVGALPSTPISISVFPLLMYELRRVTVPSFSGSGVSIGDIPTSVGDVCGRGCCLLLGVGSGEGGEVGRPLFLLMGVEGRTSIGSS